MKHAGSAPKVIVRVDCRADELRVSIRDFGRGSDGTDPGHGLIGMRERVGLFDGDPYGRAGRPGLSGRSAASAGRGHMTTSVLVVDDQALVRAGFVMILEQADGIEVVGEAENGSDAVAAAERLGPDVVLMDIRMPEMDGIEATRQIIQRGATPIHVLILTTFDPDEYVYEALAAGASGFVLKEIDPEDLVSAIETVGAGEALLRALDHPSRNRAVRQQPAPKHRTSKERRAPDRTRDRDRPRHRTRHE